ncbi:MAG: hypothetical protein ACO2PK_10985 [Armatimonadota bacterium]
MMVTLGKLLRQLCAQTPLIVSPPDDLPLSQPDDLMHPDCHARISDTIAQAALSSGLSFYGACAFGEWLAELCNGNPKQVIRLYLLPSWDALAEHLPQIQCGVAAAFAEAQRRWGEDRQKEGVC